MLLAIWLISLGLALYLYFRQTYGFLRKHGIHHLPVVYGLGNLKSTVLRQKHMTASLQEVYHTFPEDRFVGQYDVLAPIVIIKDLELIKKICVKDSDFFVDHRQMVDEETEPLFGKSLFVLKGQKWRDMRGTLSPAFTGSKMRHMVPFMLECGVDMLQDLKNKIRDSPSGSIDVDTRDLCTRYANDVIASCTFGLKVNSFKDPNNEFYNKGNAMTTFKFRQLLAFFAYASFPKLVKLFNISIFSTEVRNFFRELVIGTMNNREKNNILRPDMIHLLMEAKKGNLRHEKVHDADAGFATVEEVVSEKSHHRVWTDDDLTAQALLFFFAGFETVASTMNFVLYELALHSDIQEKCRKEISEVCEGEELTYDHIPKMKYMDMVISETMRKWPGAVATDRMCTKAYNLGKPHEKAENDYIIPEGAGVMLPMWCIQRDPDYFPDPDKFDPERFSEENKSKIDPYTYFPFGLGPRNCIGSRFALLEMKILAYQILKEFQVEPAAKTCIPAKLDPAQFNLRLQGGHWLKFTLRK